jgi:predicted ATP-grasp superfamily ATP-dependent carboligase
MARLRGLVARIHQDDDTSVHLPPVVVTDGEQRAALAVVRSLGRAGYPVHVVSARPPSLAGASRYARSETGVPDPLGPPDDYAQAVAERSREVVAEIVVPITEAALLALRPHQCFLGDAGVPWPEPDHVARICDKATVLQTAVDLGMRVPEQRVLDSRVSRSPDLSDLQFPLVLKPARSVAGEVGRKVKLGVKYAADTEELDTTLEQLPDEAFPLLLQQRIVGPGIGIFLLLWDGEVVARFAHRRIREKPPSGGVSVYRESVEADPALVEQSVRLLEAFNWQGVAMVEFKVDQASGQPYLMEVNGRFWGSLQLAVDAGVDFPGLLVAAALGQKPEPVLSYRTGVRSRWWWGDVDQLLIRMRRSASQLALPPGSPGRLRALAEFAVLWRPGDRSEVLRLGDPGPFLRESADWLRRAARKLNPIGQGD